MRGRRPRPTALKRLHGERPNRMNPGEPVPSGAPLGEPPMELDERARQAWDDIAEELTAMGLGGRVDGWALAMLAQTWSQYVHATELIRRSGLLVKDRDRNVRKNPACQLQRDAAELVVKLCRELGLTPAARSQLHLTPTVRGQVAGPAGKDPARLLA